MRRDAPSPPWFWEAPRQSCQDVRGRGFGPGRRGRGSESGGNGLRLEKEAGPEHRVRNEAAFQFRIPSGTLGNSSSRRGGGAPGFGLLPRQPSSKVTVRNWMSS